MEYEKDAEIRLRSPRDLQEALLMVELHYQKAILKGEILLVQVLSPKIQETSQKYYKEAEKWEN